MERLTLLLLRRCRRRLAGEDGVSLIELVMASGIFALVLASLAYTGTMAFADAALSRNRGVATGLANQALEQVRAVPYNTLALGLATSDLQSGTDPAITSSAGAYRYGGERIPNGNNATVAPLVPHRAAQTIDSVAYTVATYVTYLDDDTTSRALRVTVKVSWVSALRAASQKFVQAQTIVYASCTANSGACATHPFSAPVQPHLYGSSDIGDGVITFAPYTAGGSAVAGLNLAQSSMLLPTESSTMEIDQLQAVVASVKTSGVSLRATGGSDTVAGRQTVTVGSDSDPVSAKPVYARESTGTQSSSSLSMSDSSNSLTMTSSSADTATATATVLSTSTNACANAQSPAVDQLDSLPCGNGTTVQGGTMSAVLAINGMGSATLASVSNPGTYSTAHTNRDTAPQPASCTLTSADGCLRASHRQAVGSLGLGAPLSGFAAVKPAGFDYLIKLSGFTRTVVAEAGYGNANPTVTNAGTIQYWNGIGYTSLSVASGVSASIPVAALNLSIPLANTTIVLAGTFRTGGTTSTACASPCLSATATAESPIVGDLRYTVIVAGATVVDLLIHIDLGTMVARAEYSPGA